MPAPRMSFPASSGPRARFAGLGLDMEWTKSAIDLQNLSEGTSEVTITAALETLRRAHRR